jgi:chloride channel protein, CIC family
MIRNRVLRKFFTRYFVEIDQTRIVYALSLVVGLLSALAAAVLKNAIHYTNRILTEGITPESGHFSYLAYPVIGMFITILFVRYIVKDNIEHGISQSLIKAIMSAFFQNHVFMKLTGNYLFSFRRNRKIRFPGYFSI